MGLQAKLKLCNGPCNSLKHIWKNYLGAKYCKECWTNHPDKSQPKPTTKIYTIAPKSSKQAKRDVAYKVLRDIFMKNHPMCEAKLPGCSSIATECHHKRGRGEYLLDSTTFLALCHLCHSYIELHPNQAKELGFSESRLSKDGTN